MLRVGFAVLLVIGMTVGFGVILLLIGVYESAMRWLMSKFHNLYRSPSSYTYDEYFAKGRKSRKRSRDD